MKRSLKIYIGNSTRQVGVLRYNLQGARENANFEYGADWLAASDRFALEPDVRLLPGPQYPQRDNTRSIFHGFISDSEPDGWGKRVILRDHIKRRKRKNESNESETVAPLNSLDYLLGVDDFSRISALRFQDEEGTFQRVAQEGCRRAPPFVELDRILRSTRKVEENEETEEDLSYLLGRGTSLGGMRPKCTIIDEDGFLSIGKFPSISDERAVTKGEV